MDKLQMTSGPTSALADTSEWSSTGKEYEQIRINWYNALSGNLDQEDGYNCALCKNKGNTAALMEDQGFPGHYSCVFIPCTCESIRQSIHKMKASGLKNSITDCTFSKYNATEKWQQDLKEAAQAYAQQPNGWFYIGGQSGSGKTHLCTAICRGLLLQKKQVVYMLWRSDVVKLKGIVNDPEYGAEIDRYKSAEVLYIDDLFKTGKTARGAMQQPTGPDVNVAFEIINHRYSNPELLTIVSSELTTKELIAIDEAVAGRIFERAGSNALSIEKDTTKNYRLRYVVKP